MTFRRQRRKVLRPAGRVASLVSRSSGFRCDGLNAGLWLAAAMALQALMIAARRV
jgi:hypothetical protein